MRSRPCPYCRSPAWRNPCWWRLLHPHESAKNINVDPPCVCDDAAIAQCARDRRFLRNLLLMAGGMIAVALLIAWLI